MKKEEIIIKLQEIMRDVFEDNSLKICESTNTNDIEGWDSLTHITILEAVQDEFGIKLSLDEMIEMQDFGDIIAVVMRKKDNCLSKDESSELEERHVWDTSYNRGDNILFYPHEEIIRFVNKYVRKRYDINGFEDKLPLLTANSDSFASLDLGCGIGRHVKYLDECGLNPYGIDLSNTAINIGKQWMKSIHRRDLAERLLVASVTEIPFEDDYFGICVSHGVLDSMPRKVAIQGMKEVQRVLQPQALMYLDLIMGTDIREGDEIVDDEFEEGTTQSYFTIESIKSFLSEFEIIDINVISCMDETGKLRNKRAHIIIKNTK